MGEGACVVSNIKRKAGIHGAGSHYHREAIPIEVRVEGARDSDESDHVSTEEQGRKIRERKRRAKQRRVSG